MKNITITSYNIHKGMSPLNRLVQMNAMGEALQTLSPDILCLQEVQGRHLKRAVAYNEFPEESQHEWFGEYLNCKGDYGKNCEYSHGHHGNAILSRYPLDPKHNVNITVNRLEKRGVLHSEVYPDGWGTKVVVLSAHLNLLHKDRIKQYEAISTYVLDEIHPDTPLILAGDFNDWTKKSTARLSALGLTEVFEYMYGKTPATFPAKLPVLSLDRIYVKNLTIKNAIVHAGVPWSDLSDHLPISAIVGLN